MINRCMLGAGVALAVALGGVQAHAQWFGPYPPGAFYLGPEGGWTSLGSESNTFTLTKGVKSRSFSPQKNYNSGFNAGVRGGYEWGPWRFEEEYSYRNNDLSNFDGNSHAFSGSTHSNAIMTNVIYDFTFGWPITPHIGGGVGAINIDTGVSLQNGATTPAPFRNFPTRGAGTFTSLNGNTWEVGYQGIAGIRYNVNPVLAIDLDYRYVGAPSFTVNSQCPVQGCGRTTSVKVGNYHSQNLVASLTMSFGAPPPVAPPPAPGAPPPPMVHQVYLVFFDWDKYNITPQGLQILDAAAAHFKAGGAVQIQVTGYTDLSGSAGYNQRLSERRANAVAVALEHMGVPRNDMLVSGRGMNDPRVPTALGVREPQNRRVEILFP